VDSREPKAEQAILDEAGIEYEIQALETGDYSIINENGAEICMERKEMKDLISSLFSGRLDNQMRRLADKDHPILLITGSFSEYTEAVKKSHGKTFFTKDQLIGKVASIAVSYGIQIVWFTKWDDNRVHSDGLKLAVKMIKKIAEGKYLKPKPPSVKRNTNKQRELVRTLFNISPELADALIKKFGTIRTIINATDEDLLYVKGMGKTRLERARAILDGKHI